MSYQASNYGQLAMVLNNAYQPRLAGFCLFSVFMLQFLDNIKTVLGHILIINVENEAFLRRMLKSRSRV